MELHNQDLLKEAMATAEQGYRDELTGLRTELQQEQEHVQDLLRKVKALQDDQRLAVSLEEERQQLAQQVSELERARQVEEEAHRSTVSAVKPDRYVLTVVGCDR